MRNLILTAIAVCSMATAFAQDNFPVNGVREVFEETYLLKDAFIYNGSSDDTMASDLLIRDGRIVAMGTDLDEQGAIIVDLEGKYIYPSFIDLYAQYGIEDLPKKKGYPEQFLSDKPGAYSWNEALRSEFRAHEAFVTDAKAGKGWRKAGFGAVLTHSMDGISRGSSAFVLLSDQKSHEVIVKEQVAHHLTLKRGTSMQDYPSSQMGAIALIRQAYLDAEWYEKADEDVNLSLAGWNALKDHPKIFEAPGHLGILRVDKLGDEFGEQYIILGSGKEYRRIDAIKGTNATLILPVDYIDAFDVEDPWQAEYVTLEDMKHWELGPYNLARVHEAGIPFAITSYRLESRSDLIPNVRTAVQKGLPHDAAVDALTRVPAEIMGLDEEIGSLSAGKIANLLVTDKPVFEDGAVIYQNWVNGIPYQLKPFDHESVDGTYKLIFGDDGFPMVISGSADGGSITLSLNDSTDIDGTFQQSGDQVWLTYALPDGHRYVGYSTLSGWKIASGMKGNGKLPNGTTFTWEAVLETAADGESKNESGDDVEQEDVGPVIYPFTAYGWETAPTGQRVLFKNATVWTNEQEGILIGTDVLIDNGKIVRVGKDLTGREATVIDATGKHLTCGIIDEHSHIGISAGVNEGSQSSSAEVSIGDVVNSEDVNWYRQLAGGVTAAQLLHGSANPIGGRSALVKFRWGSLPDDMKIDDAVGFIKFALGENVKRSNWSSGVKRFPQTRMGVEQVFVDYFTRAEAYDADPGPKRRDIEMEVIAEILNKERFVSCHSYVQSEINMLMKVAEDFDFHINTFTHILEGYKLADKMAEHGVGGSTFSDWWAYKYEVIDAIPYNAAVMDKMDVVTAINSDDAEMGRRLNQEAAKAVRFGNVSEEEAWKMVTLNPAKLLHLDDRMGSIKSGKDADLVLWSDNPLSIYAVVEQTYVDGVKYYDAAENEALEEFIAEERARLIQKMLEAKLGGAKVVTPVAHEEHYYHCDDLEDWSGSHHHE